MRPPSPTASPIFVDLDPRAEHALSEAGISLTEILKNAGISGDVIRAPRPDTSYAGTTPKDPSLAIIAAGVSLYLIAAAISRVLTTITRRPHLVVCREIVPLRDASGNLDRDAQGNPLYEMRERPELLTPPSGDTPGHAEVSVTPTGLVLSFKG